MIAEHDQGKKDSPMGRWLLDKLHKRKISTPDFVEGCQAEVQSNASSSYDPVISKVARLKSKGSNTSRDVNNILSKDCRLLECYEADIPLWDSSSGTQIISKMRFLNIHEVIDDIVRQHPEVDFCSFAPDQESFEEQEEKHSSCNRFSVSGRPESYCNHFSVSGPLFFSKKKNAVVTISPFLGQKQIEENITRGEIAINVRSIGVQS